MEKIIKAKPFQRFMSFEQQTVDTDNRTAELSFSSELPVERFFGNEILDHKPGSVDLSRLNNSAPVLFNHNMDDYIGVVEEASIVDLKGRAKVRFSKSERANQIFQDIQDGILRNVSVSYVINKLEEVRGTDIPTYRATSWQPLEISMVTVPADPTVGVGREMEQEHDIVIISEDKQEEVIIDDRNINDNVNTQELPLDELTQEVIVMEKPEVDVEAIRKAETDRVSEILAIGQKHNAMELAQRYIGEGKSVADFKGVILEKMETKPVDTTVVLTTKEEQSYSLVRAIGSTLEKNSKGFEVEVSNEIAKKVGRETRGIFVPLNMSAKRDATPLNTAANSVGGNYTVQTDVMTLIDLLRNKMVVQQAGATFLSGLSGNVQFPRQTAAATLAWTGENPGSDVADSNATFDQVTLSPKTAMASTAYSYQLLSQSTLDVENFVRNDLTKIMALGVDKAALLGTNESNQPKGVYEFLTPLTQSGAITWGDIIALEEAVETANALFGSLAYITNPKVKASLKIQGKNQYGYVPIWENNDTVNGYRAFSTQQLPNTFNTDKSAIFFGNWSDLLIGEWGVLEIISDPFSKKKQGLVEVTCIILVDIAVRHAASFAVIDTIAPQSDPYYA